MPLADRSKLENLRTAFETAIQEVFGDRPDGQAAQFTQRIDASGDTRVEVPVVDGAPAPREWTGSKQFGGLKAYSVAADLRKWERSLEIPMDDISANDGLVAQRLQQFVSETANIFDYVAFQAALSGNSGGILNNPVGYDQVSLLNNSHPDVGSSGTSDNLTTNGLSRSELSSGIQALNEMKDEAGEPLRGGATHLVVGPAQEEYALELTGSDKPVAVDESGDLNQGSSGVGSNLIRNFWGGSIQVISTPRITGNEWFLMNLGTSRRPVFMFEFQAPDSQVKDRPEDDNVFHRDVALYSITYKATPMAGDWHTVYGSVTS